MKYCTKCGKENPDGSKFCKNCGNEIQNIDNENERTQPIEIPKPSDYPENNKNYISTQNSISNVDNDYENGCRHIKKSTIGIFSGIIPKVLIGVVLIVAILAGVFFNRISAQYYMSKSNNAFIEQERIMYAIKAVRAFNSNETKELFKNALVKLAENDVKLAEEKLEEMSAMLSQGEFKNIASDIKGKKVDKLCSESKYDEALNEFNEIDKLGGDFKTNKNYENVMINIISKLTGSAVRNNKNSLMESDGITFENFDEDTFDEIVEVKNKSAYYNSEIKVNLYKFKDGKYKLVDSKTINSAFNGKTEGIYDYATDKKGVFVNYESTPNGFATCVFGIENSKLSLKGTVFGNNYTKPEDVENDGVYEIISNSTSNVYSSIKDNSKWFKVYEDGRTPTEVNVNGSKTIKNDSNSTSSDDYILKNSDKDYLMEDDLRDLNKEQLALARNEIFARHGYVFKEEKFKNYFTSKSWYVPNSNYNGGDSVLNEYEKANYEVIQNWEKK